MTLTRLIVGTPRFGIPAPKPTLRPPRTQPCLEPLVYGAQVLNDPGFETYSDLPDYPETTSNGHPDFAADPIPQRRWVQLDSQGAGRLWVISTTVPRSGIRHARWDEDQASAEKVWWIEKAICHPQDETLAYSARVEPGNLVKVGMWAKSDAASGDNLQLQIDTLDLDGVVASGSGVSRALTASYGLCEHQITVGASGRYVMVGFATVSGAGAQIVDVDDAALQVA